MCKEVVALARSVLHSKSLQIADFLIQRSQTEQNAASCSCALESAVLRYRPQQPARLAIPATSDTLSHCTAPPQTLGGSRHSCCGAHLPRPACLPSEPSQS